MSNKNPERTEQVLKRTNLTKRSAPATAGFQYLHEQFHSQEMNFEAKRLMKQVLDEAGWDTRALYEAPSADAAVYTQVSPLPLSLQQEGQIILNSNPPPSEAIVLSLAQAGQLSFWGNLLAVVDAAAPLALSAKLILKSASLCLYPPLIPGQTEAREVVGAALSFLVSKVQDAGKLVPPLPLLRIANPHKTDPEKHTYVKAYAWNLDDLRQPCLLSDDAEAPISRLLQLERIFFASTPSNMPRVRYALRSHDDASSQLMVKGSVPPSLKGKNKGGNVSWYSKR